MLDSFRSKGEAKAMFLRHEGFLGAVGAFMNYKLVEEFPNSNSLVGDLTDNGIIECRVHVSSWTVFNIDNHPLLFIINIIMLYLTSVIVGPITNWKECRGEKGKERWCSYVIVLLSFYTLLRSTEVDVHLCIGEIYNHNIDMVL